MKFKTYINISNNTQQCIACVNLEFQRNIFMTVEIKKNIIFNYILNILMFQFIY